MKQYWYEAIHDGRTDKIVARTERVSVYESEAKICDELMRKYGPRYTLMCRQIVGQELKFMLTGKL